MFPGVHVRARALQHDAEFDLLCTQGFAPSGCRGALMGVDEQLDRCEAFGEAGDRRVDDEFLYAKPVVKAVEFAPDMLGRAGDHARSVFLDAVILNAGLAGELGCAF